ncbi:MAG TPA: hypothetical protein VKT77_01180 [Chthonomonadaceae bacterium]|nr:hypothetical protein [Chthonomonadaceae bacterium]
MADARLSQIAARTASPAFRIDWQLPGRGFYKAGFEMRNLAGHAAMELDDFELR